MGSYPIYKGIILFFLIFYNSYKLLFLSILIFRTLISISSNTWIRAWIGLEINLLSFIPLINDRKNLISTESSLKYFLIQVLASSSLLFFIIIYIFFYYRNEIYINNFINWRIISSLLIKIGIAPFHFWLPNVIEGINWNNTFIILTWQKIAPIILISYLKIYYLIIPILLSIIIGSLGGFNQISLRKILAYSSINHLGWINIALIINNNIWLNYFIIYSILSFTLIYYFKINKLYFINQIYIRHNNYNELKLILFFNFLSFGGLPPFLGFFPKWKIIENISFLNSFLITIIVITTLITLFYYIRICYSRFIISYSETNYILYIKFNTIYIFLSFISIFGILIINLLYIL